MFNYNWKEKLVDGFKEWILPPLGILLFVFMIAPTLFGSVMFTRYLFCDVMKSCYFYEKTK